MPCTVYIDPTFYEELKRRFGAPGDFAQAYVIADEFGHHIQNQLGISRQVQALQGRVSHKECNKSSVRLELQADFLAGVWAYREPPARGSEASPSCTASARRSTATCTCTHA